MTIASEFDEKKNRLVPAIAISAITTGVVGAALLRLFGVSLVFLALAVGVAVILWLMWRHPIGGLGTCLAFMPFLPVTVLLVGFLGPSYINLASGYTGVGLVLLIFCFVLWRRNGVKFTLPDWFLLVTFALATLRFALGGTLIALLTDFAFMVPYAAGRVTVLSDKEADLWAGRAVWIVAILAILGMSEIFVFGEGPRTVLYLAVTNGATEGESLNPTFHAAGYGGMRESATMFGPLTFGVLCMVALIIWWVYRRNPIPAGMIAAGLICSLTRSAWVGAVLAIAFLSVVMMQKTRLLRYAALALALFAVSIPLLGLGDYLLATREGQDPSAQGHQESIVAGLRYVSDHPFGAGPGNAGSFAAKNDNNAISFEDTYLTLAAEYGVVTTLCFLGFIFSAARVSWQMRTPLGYAALGILVGFGAAMTVAALHQDLPLQSWIWFPVGLAVRFSENARVFNHVVGGL